MKALLKGIPGARWLYQVLAALRWTITTGSFRFVRLFPPGHFHSPIPDGREAPKAESACVGIDLRENEQLGLLEAFSRYYGELPWGRGGTHYRFENGFFGYGDAITLYSVMRHFGPRRVVEAGSGYSSAAMLDVAERFLNGTEFTFIEPHPDRLLGLLGDDRRIVRERVQDVPLAVFEALRENDLLFVDSSHVVKLGSDVGHILFRVLPALRPGVLIHFHDIFWPFEYPREWFLEGRAWNEAYFLRAFLQHNDAFEVVFFNSYLAACHGDTLYERMPLYSEDPGCSLWLRKL